MQPIINFVLRNSSDLNYLQKDEACNISINDLAPRLHMGREVWIVQTFQILRQRGYPVHLSEYFHHNAINIAHYDDIIPCKDLWQYFIVSVRADRDPTFISQLEIVQNMHSMWTENDYYIPHWPQPGLIPRNPTRKNKIENITYMGKNDNLKNDFKTSYFQHSLKLLGMRLYINESEWWNYYDSDAVLAVRGGPQYYLAIKPATKLVNAWIAGCPAILSPEPGYSELRKSDVDYLEATDSNEVLNGLSMLKDSPQLTTKMIANGKYRSADFDVASITRRWEQFIFDAALDKFNYWQRNTNELNNKYKYLVALINRRLWGHWAVGSFKSQWKETLGKIRRRLLLPKSV